MRVPITLPDLGNEPGQPVALSVWFADEGELVYEGDRLVEVIIAGATFDMCSPATGHLAEIVAWPNDLLQPGQVLGWIGCERRGLPPPA